MGPKTTWQTRTPQANSTRPRVLQPTVKSHLAFTLLCALIMMVMFTLLRVALLVYNREMILDTPASTFSEAFGNGLRFDAADCRVLQYSAAGGAQCQGHGHARCAAFLADCSIQPGAVFGPDGDGLNVSSISVLTVWFSSMKGRPENRDEHALVWLPGGALPAVLGCRHCHFVLCLPRRRIRHPFQRYPRGCWHFACGGALVRPCSGTWSCCCWCVSRPVAHCARVLRCVGVMPTQPTPTSPISWGSTALCH